VINSALDLIVGPTAITGVILGIVGYFPARYYWGRRKFRDTQRAHAQAITDASSAHARALEDAVAAVIAELETNPHDYATLPQSVRDRLYKAYER
jgi:hypothetical protein